MATNTLTGWTNKFLQKLPFVAGATTVDAQQAEARTLLNAASHTDTVAALATKQDQSDALDAYADAAGADAAAIAATRRALISAASDDSPNFNSPTALTAAEGNRSSLLATTEFVWDGGPLKAIPPDGANAGSLLAQYNNTVAADTLGFGAVDLQSLRSLGSSTATGLWSFIAGGAENTASGEGSHAEGYANIASGGYSHVEGTGCVASGLYSHAEGNSNTASGTYSHAGGYENIASLQGQVTYGGASSNTQHSRFDAYKQTTNATPAILYINGSNEKLTIRSGWSMAGTVNILGIKTTDGTVAAHYIRKFAIKNVAGTTSLSGTVTALGTDYESDAGLDVAITANDTDDSLDITVTGLAATTIRWAAVVDAVEVKLT